eukprot:Blabericola_migrator_1__6863@NODE_3476_length_1743_cov_10_705847_g2161_i0_p1_GENE_NODE_3476_length_1743_cov_10_705847_g2161_i0NODE_3476_length_1743_cov_10_705847_g2161_i0_p1_ORF_typecomplete_len106_score7_53RVP/PF00077_20/0_011_NODE_3476_length_1743_cov_10_705847_g2161_i045362
MVNQLQRKLLKLEGSSAANKRRVNRCKSRLYFGHWEPSIVLERGRFHAITTYRTSETLEDIGLLLYDNLKVTFFFEKQEWPVTFVLMPGLNRNILGLDWMTSEAI